MMKKIVLSMMAAVAFLMLVAIPGTSFATGECASMKVVHVGMSSAAPSGVEVFLKNQTGKACGSLANNAVGAFWLPTKNTDKTLAILLTAASLQKNIWVWASGTGEPYVIGFISVKNISD